MLECYSNLVELLLHMIFPSDAVDICSPYKVHLMVGVWLFYVNNLSLQMAFESITSWRKYYVNR